VDEALAEARRFQLLAAIPFLLAFAAIVGTALTIASPGRTIGSISGKIESAPHLGSSLDVRLDNGKSIISAADPQLACAPGSRARLDVRLHDWPWRRTSYRVGSC
jgi:hypothetical protein